MHSQKNEFWILLLLVVSTSFSKYFSLSQKRKVRDKIDIIENSGTKLTHGIKDKNQIYRLPMKKIKRVYELAENLNTIVWLIFDKQDSKHALDIPYKFFWLEERNFILVLSGICWEVYEISSPVFN